MPSQVLSGEEQAVMSVVAAEAAAFFRRDFVTYATCWSHAPDVRRMGWWTHGGVNNSWGWDEISRLVRKSMDDFPIADPSSDEIRFENVVVRISGDMAYATFDQYGPESPAVGKGGRVLEFKEGRWRIIYECYLVDIAAPTRTALIKVNRDGVVRWMNAAAESVTTPGGPLRLIGGRLAARGTQDTRRIRAAIQRVWDYDHLAEPSADRGTATVPILLQQDIEDAVCVCWISNSGSMNGRVQVTLNDAAFAREKMRAAAQVFGLSPTQQKLVEMIASGQDVVTCAASLGVKVNTARTHLQRVYDKVGVRSQAALVRTLLSI
jgi:DNA-binding CsgD family transcriptional regulator